MSIEIVVGQALFIIGLAIIGMCFNKLFNLDLGIGCVVAGLLANALAPLMGLNIGIYSNNLQALVFYFLLPILIFEATWHINTSYLKKLIKPIILLASVGVILSTLISATLIYYGINHPTGFPWIAALICGVILATTDTTTILRKFSEHKIPSQLITLIKGENLFGDATTFVLFSLLLAIATQTNVHSELSIGAFFTATFVGGLVLGSIFGLVAAITTLLLGSHSTTRIVLLFASLASFYTATHVFEVSGIMTVIGTAITARLCLDEREHSFLMGADGNWHWLALLFSSVLFVIMGLVMSADMFSERWLAIIIGIAAAFISRALTIYFCCIFSRPLSHTIEKSWQPILIWGDIRGVLAIALALSLPTTLSYWWTIQAIVFGVVLFNLLFQAPTIHWLIKKMRPESL